MDIQWNQLFAFGVSPWELTLRGSLMYWFVFILLRLAGRRDFGAIGSADVLLVVLIADAAQNAMSAGYESVAEGMVLVGTLILWSVVVDRIGYFWPSFARLLDPGRVCLVKDGIMQRRGMRREYVTPDELMSALRQQGIDDLSKVRRAYMEAQGSISILKAKE